MADLQIKDLTEQTALDDSDKFLIQNGLTDDPMYTTAETMAEKANSKAEWQEIGRLTLTPDGDTLSVASLPAYKYLRVVASIIPSGAIDAIMRLNNDSGSNYAYRFDLNNGTTSTSTANNFMAVNPTGAAVAKMIVLEILNVSSLEKLIQGRTTEAGTAGAANLPSSAEYNGKWANTSVQINRIDIINNGGIGDFDTGSELIVYGHN